MVNDGNKRDNTLPDDGLSTGFYCFSELAKWATRLQHRIIDLETRVNELSHRSQQEKKK